MVSREARTRTTAHAHTTAHAPPHTHTRREKEEVLDRQFDFLDAGEPGLAHLIIASHGLRHLEVLRDLVELPLLLCRGNAKR